MTPQTAAVLAGQIRTVLAALLTVAVAKVIPASTLNDLLQAVILLTICGWSIWQKEATAQSLFQTMLGAARNLLVIGLNYAAARGWLGAEQVNTVAASVGTLAVMAWSAEQKVNTVPA